LTAAEKFRTWEIRAVENKYAIEKIVSSPIWGIGFQRAYRPQIYYPEDNIEWFIHNGYLWIMLKLGVLGFIPFLWFSYIFLKRGMKYWYQVEDRVSRGIVLGSVCAYLGFAVGNIASPNFMQNWEVAVFGLCFGMNEVIYRVGGLNSESRATIKIEGK
jgi:O-antigen ligase